MTNKKLNLNFYPGSLFKESSDTLGDEFTRLPKRFKTGYTNTFWTHNGIIRHNQHNRDPESFAMGAEEITDNFKEPKDFNIVNHRDKGYYLRPSKGNRDGNKYVVRHKEEDGSIKCEPTNWLIKTEGAFQTWREGGVKGSKNGFRLSPTITDLLDGWYIKSEEELEAVGFTNHEGETLESLEERLGGAISRDKSTVSDTVNVNLYVTINKESLLTHKRYVEVLVEELETREIKVLKDTHPQWKEVVEEVVERGRRKEEEAHQADEEALGGVNRELPLQALLSKDLKLEGAKQRLLEINTLLVTAREHKNSSVHVIYTEANTGRYTADGAVLQGYHKSVRYAALSGCYEYDLEAAHQNILLQLLAKQGVDFPELDVLREYVSNKKGIRLRLSEELGASVDVVKEIISALTYGAELNRSPKQSLYDSCDGDKELLDKVVSHLWLKDLVKVFKLAHQYLVTDKDNIVNAVGIKYSKEEANDSSELAHILQGVERLVLDTVIKHSNRDDIALLVHDCVVFYTKQDIDELSTIVKEETGFDLEFSEESY